MGTPELTTEIVTRHDEETKFNQRYAQVSVTGVQIIHTHINLNRQPYPEGSTELFHQQVLSAHQPTISVLHFYSLVVTNGATVGQRIKVQESISHANLNREQKAEMIVVELNPRTVRPR